MKKQSDVERAAEAFLREFCKRCEVRGMCSHMTWCSSMQTGFRTVPLLRRAVLAARKARKVPR